MSVLALLSLVALLFTRGIPTVQPGSEPTAESPADLGEAVAERG